MNQAPPPLSLEGLLHALRRHKAVAALTAAAVLGVTTAVTFLTPRTYQSDALLFVRLGRENATLDPTATLGQASVVAMPSSRETEMASVLEMLRSRSLAEEVVNKVGADVVLGRAATGEDHYPAIEALQRGLTVETGKKSSVVHVAWAGPSPDACQQVVRALIEIYCDQHVQLNRTPGAYRFLSEQTANVRARLEQAEEALRTAKDETGLGAPEVERHLLGTRIARIDDELLQARASLAATRAEVQALASRRDALPKTQVTATTRGIPNVAADTMRGQLYALQLKALELLKHPEGNPVVKQVRQQTEAAKELLAREEKEREQVTEGPGKLYEEACVLLLRQEAQQTALQARVQALEGQLEQEKKRLTQLNRDSQRVARLQREADVLDASYRKCAGSMEQIEIDQAMEAQKISNISVAQQASLDPRPVRPRRSVYLGLGLVAALGAGALAALARERLRPSGLSATPTGGPDGGPASAPGPQEGGQALGPAVAETA